MAFQIVDDIMDFTSDTIKLGKPVGNDLMQGIVTLPVIIYAENNATDEEITSLVDGKCLDNDTVGSIINKVRNSDAIEKAQLEADEYVKSATSMLTGIEPGEYLSGLMELSKYITLRSS
jgi:heptaprenyl diphosphate synthase